MWAIEANELLKHLNVWRVVDGSGIIPRPPTAPAPPGSTTTHTAPDSLDPLYDFQPESTDSSYLAHFDNFLQDWRAYCNKHEKTSGTICVLLEQSLCIRYEEDKFNYPKVLWEAI
jgi:hypothetical protein